MSKLKVWGRGYRPFVMGGKVHYYGGTEADIREKVTFGNIEVAVVQSPDGKKTLVAEVSTGAIVGRDLDTVLEDIRTAESSVAQDQLAWARQHIHEVEWFTPEYFWSVW